MVRRTRLNKGGRVTASCVQKTPGGTVGQSPFVKNANPTTVVKSFLIPVRITFQPQNIVFDPAVSDPCAAANTSGVTIPFKLTKQSPIYQTHAYTLQGVSAGTSLQYADAFQRANFWKVRADPNWSTQL